MSNSRKIAVPNVSLPKGGGAVKGIGETFQPNAFSGTATFSIPIPTTPCRGFEPQLSLDYSSGSGNGVFGIGFSLAIPNISRKTEKGFPKYDDTDTFLISNADDLVPKLVKKNGEWKREERADKDNNYTITLYRPRTEGLFARIERWVRNEDRDTHWRVTTKDNVTSIYGERDGARVADPANPCRVFQWLLECTYDAKGNRIAYEYADDKTNKYIRKIKYGNHPAGKTDGWHFELLFDYGERRSDTLDQLVHDTNETWKLREDPFSSYRAGFEIRTQRLCRRILLFHRFGDDVPFLVHGTHLTYTETPCLSLLARVSQVGYRKDHEGVIHHKAMPPLDLTYSQPANAPVFRRLTHAAANGDNGALHQPIDELVDLYGDGLPGILHSNEHTTLYSRPQGGGHYASPIAPAHFPIDRNLESGQYALLDLGGDGKLDLVAQTPAGSGYFESNPVAETWEPFCAFPAYPIDVFSEGRQMADVTGDGLADLVMFEANAVKVYPSQGKHGFAPATVRQRENELPLTRQGSPVEHVGFADLIGDGGNHLVRIRSASVECWPHLGYGRFGEKVILENAPDFGGQLDPARLLLTDIDGSGTTDLVYACHDRLQIYRNQSGNGFAEMEELALPQGYDNLDHIRFADVLGNGTACLILTTRGPDLRFRHEYFDFNTAGKPHLLIRIDNNMGAMKNIHYAASTKYYLVDRKAGKPWATRLSFPVQVIESVEVTDKIAGSRLVTRYAYHDGYYDPDEREFRGFGYVEQWDTETFDAHQTWVAEDEEHCAYNVDKDHYVAPVYTRSWYHTGAQVAQGRLSDHYRRKNSSQDQPCLGHYYEEDSDSDHDHLPDSALDEATFAPQPETIGEVYRALHGHKLREEIYGQDHKRNPKLKNPKLDEHPYAVTESNFKIRLLQPMEDQKHAVCFVHPSEEISWHYERNPEDPRVEHGFTVDVDDYGHVRKSCHVFYPRRDGTDVHPEQQPSHLKALATVDAFINVDPGQDATKDFYLVGIPCEEKEYEIGGLQADGHNLLKASQIASHLEEALRNEIPFEQTVTGKDPQARLLSWKRHFYWDHALEKPLDFRAVAAHELHHHSETAVFSKDAVADVFADKVSAKNLTGILTEARYGLKEDGYWWNPGLVQHYQNNEGFYLPNRTVDPVGICTHVTYDEYQLVPITVTDALGNQTRAEIDYHALQPWRVTDINGNKSEVLFDPLGMVIATSIYKQEDGKLRDGDAPLASHIFCVDACAADVFEFPGRYLQQATSYFYYELGYVDNLPPHSVALQRETHVHDLKADEAPKIHVHIAYSDGFGRALQTKVKAGPGLAFGFDANGNLVEAPAEVRWLTSGRTVYNNKGKPVKQYEPFYTATVEYIPEPKLNQHGVTHVTHYDPLLRVVRVTNPDGFFSKVEFTPWEEKHYDENDTDGYNLRLVSDPKQLEDGRDHGESLVIIGQLGGKLHFRVFDADGKMIADKREDGISSDRAITLQELKALLGDPLPETISGVQMKKVTEMATILVGHARKNSPYFNTPETHVLDTQGRAFQIIQQLEGAKELEQLDSTKKLVTRHELDIQGNELSSTDPKLFKLNLKNKKEGKKEHRNFQHVYDMTGTVLWTKSADAGERWALHDAMGRPIHAWNSRNFHTTTRYDALHRLVEVHVKGGDGDKPLDHAVERTVYGEGQADDKKHNLRGKLVRHYDQAGVVHFNSYDIKGELHKTTRRLRKEYKQEANWPKSGEDVLLEDEEFVTEWIHDALGRITRETHPDRSISTPQYHPEGWLKQLDVKLAAANDKTATPFVKEISYNPKGQRKEIQYGNGVVTRNTYDDNTFRLIRLETTSDGEGRNNLQDLQYTYDPVGNITAIRDDAQPTAYFRNQRVEASAKYAYDALYRLIEATGREHLGQGGSPVSSSHDDTPRVGIDWSSNDGNAMGRYVESYDYDAVGNILSMRHRGTDPAKPGWNR